MLIFSLGLCLGGAYNFISTACVIELSKQPELKNKPSATSIITAVNEGNIELI